LFRGLVLMALVLLPLFISVLLFAFSPEVLGVFLLSYRECLLCLILALPYYFLVCCFGGGGGGVDRGLKLGLASLVLPSSILSFFAIGLYFLGVLGAVTILILGVLKVGRCSFNTPPIIVPFCF